MAIYTCECGCVETTMSDMKRHLKENPTHGTGATWGKCYRRVTVDIDMKARNS